MGGDIAKMRLEALQTGLKSTPPAWAGTARKLAMGLGDEA